MVFQGISDLFKSGIKTLCATHSPSHCGLGKRTRSVVVTFTDSWWKHSLRNHFCIYKTATVSRDQFSALNFPGAANRKKQEQGEVSTWCAYLLYHVMTSPHVNDREAMRSVSPEVLLYNHPEVRVGSVCVCRCICKLSSLWGIWNKYIYLRGKPNKWDNHWLYLWKHEIA